MSAYATEIAVRWSDMDSFGHVNNACTVTLIEEARTQLLLSAGGRNGVSGLNQGVVVVRLSVHYRRPLQYTGAPVRVRVWLARLATASFTLDCEVADGPSGEVVATARTELARYDVAAGRPCRLTALDREFLAGFYDLEESGGDA